MINKEFWNGKKVLITGHTGFKGTWLTLWLASLGAEVIGYSLDPPSSPNLYEITETSRECLSYYGDINNYSQLQETMTTYQPQIIFHMAAQPLVRTSYQYPIETFHTNVIGTVHVLEAVRKTASARVVINITSDKCYQNNDKDPRSFCENDRLGGHDPYSASKACAELVTESYRKSFFNLKCHSDIRLASARAGNVIGGGDWAEGRLFTDMMKAFLYGKALNIRNPNAVRPWQHVLEPLNGYLLLAEKLWNDSQYSDGWNFGPIAEKDISVDEVVNITMKLWDKQIEINYDNNDHPHESPFLKLNSSNAFQRLGWKPKLSTKESIDWAVQWYKNYEVGENMNKFTLKQINDFQKLKRI
ncbi:CDP-glucose 4,6-dehydratase [Peribacillus simplex]|uniref:CDP-glucose 4,6-dehydratase n=1 Tax=Peribacillus simplex TaxID=1478 RepID=UPI00203FAEBD|nr:CDP-glucose 4,6-dehydratase [Peribacillus simplex]MCM3677502.1 CDP-glucose 4,6-dehydratase [Peribacillus simplex]